MDFQPYASRTDGLLFTYEELRDIFSARPEHSPSSDSVDEIKYAIPELRVITSRTHPSSTRVAPQHAHNMMPREALELSAGRSILDFQDTWKDELAKAMAEESDEDSESRAADEQAST